MSNKSKCTIFRIDTLRHNLCRGSLSIRRFWGKGERWRRKRERGEGEKLLFSSPPPPSPIGRPYTQATAGVNFLVLSLFWVTSDMPLHMEEIKGKTFNKFQSLQLDWLHMKGRGAWSVHFGKVCFTKEPYIEWHPIFKGSVSGLKRHRNQRKHWDNSSFLFEITPLLDHYASIIGVFLWLSMRGLDGNGFHLEKTGPTF